MDVKCIECGCVERGDHQVILGAYGNVLWVCRQCWRGDDYDEFFSK